MLEKQNNMDPYESFFIEPICKHLSQCLHDTYDSKSELKMLHAIRDFINLRIDECAIASEEEIKNGFTDELGVLYSYDRVKLIKGDKDLKHYVIKTGTKIICDNAFTDCTFLSSISIPDTVEIIGHSSFCRCVNLKSIQIPNSVKRIKGECFWYCRELAQAYMPEIDYIPEDSFVGCKLEEFEIPPTVRILEKSCFASCHFKEIVIPQYVKSIEKRSFYCCRNLETIKFESSFVEKIDEEAFKECDSIKHIYVPKGKKEYFIGLLPEEVANFVTEYDIENNENIKKSIWEEMDISLEYSQAKESAGTIWTLSDFLKIYNNWEIWTGADSKKGLIYFGVFGDDNKNFVVAMVSQKVGEYSTQALEKAKSNLIVKVTSSRRYLLCEKWE